jgi:hypothetical protein
VNVRIKIPIIAHEEPEITKAAVMNSPRLVTRAVAIRMTAVAMRRIAATA